MKYSKDSTKEHLLKVIEDLDLQVNDLESKLADSEDDVAHYEEMAEKYEALLDDIFETPRYEKSFSIVQINSIKEAIKNLNL